MKCRAPSGDRRPSDFQVAVHLDGDLAQGPSTKYTVSMGRAFRSGLLPYPQYMSSSASTRSIKHGAIVIRKPSIKFFEQSFLLRAHDWGMNITLT